MNSLNGIYATRTCRTWCYLSEGMFNILNKEGIGSLEFVGGGCIDAPEQIPAGSVKSYGRNERMVLPNIIGRTKEIESITAEREAIAERLLEEILREENISK